MHPDQITRKLPSRSQLVSVFKVYGENGQIPLMPKVDLKSMKDPYEQLHIEQISVGRAALLTLERQIDEEVAEETLLELALRRMALALSYQDARGFPNIVREFMSELSGKVQERRYKRRLEEDE